MTRDEFLVFQREAFNKAAATNDTEMLIDFANFCELVQGYLKSKKVDTSITVTPNQSVGIANVTVTTASAAAPHRRMGVPDVARALAASQDTKSNSL
jgi:hypothetical protein